MLQAFVITLREGLEAFLIVAISLAYLRKSGRRELVPAVHWGIALRSLRQRRRGVPVSARDEPGALGGRPRPRRGGLGGVADRAHVAHGAAHQERHRRHLEASALKAGATALIGVFLFTLLMITREGMETALLMGTLLFQEDASNISLGAIGGTLSAAFVAWLWSRYGHRVNLALFFQVTAIFLLGLRRAAADLRLPRADRSEHLPVQRTDALGHRAVWTGRPLWADSQLCAAGAASRLAGICGALRRQANQRSPAVQQTATR